MNTSVIKNRLNELKFYGMQNAFQAYLQTGQEQLSGIELLDHLLQQEWEFRQNRNISTRIRLAHFRYQATIEQIDCTAHRNLSKDLLLRLADCSFIEKKENILITGPTGVGKSFIASALGHQACIMGYKVLYFNTIKLFRATAALSLKWPEPMILT